MGNRNSRRMAKFNARKQMEHLEEVNKKIHSDNTSIAEFRVNKALTAVTPKDDVVMKQEPHSDAIYKVVNHAHRRDPKKKW